MRFEASPTPCSLVIRRDGFPPRRPKVLVVDDDEDFREFLCFLLTGLGVDVAQARHGHEALSNIDLELPDVVLLDHCMPGLTGAHVARSMLATGQKATVVLVTGEPSIDEIATAAGTRWRLAKPFTSDQLRDVLSAVIDDA